MKVVKIILDHDRLFRRVEKFLYNPRTRRFTEPAFMLRLWKKETALSVNWEKYITPEMSSYSGKKRYCVGAIRALVPRFLGLDAIHKPGKNIAHSVICGDGLLDSQRNYVIAGSLAEACEPLIITEE